MISLSRFHQHLTKLSIISTKLLSSKVPKDPIYLEKPNCTVQNIDKETILHLERLSLVDFGDKSCVKILEEAIQFAEQLSSVNTEGIEPLISVLEESHLRLREDIVTDGHKRQEVLSNAKITDEDYFVAPPGNIPADPSQSANFSSDESHKCMEQIDRKHAS